jgi:ankyrin repeat protein
MSIKDLNESWERLVIDLEEGNFSSLEKTLGGPAGFDRQIIGWFESDNFDNEPEMLAEALTCACMLGRTDTARHLIDAGVDPYAGMKTWLAGPHYAASGAHLDIVKMLLEKKISLEVKNLYGGTLLGQALWSAVNEFKPDHAAIIEVLLDAGASVEPGTVEWWKAQNVPYAQTKQRVLDALLRHGAQ